MVMNRLWIDWCIFDTITTPCCKLRLVSNLDNHPTNEFMKPSSTFRPTNIQQNSINIHPGIWRFLWCQLTKKTTRRILSHSPVGTHAALVIFAPKLEARSKLQSYKTLNWCRIFSPSAVSIKICYCFKVSYFFSPSFFLRTPPPILIRG